jgi:deoxycytidylate deaminase
MKDKDINFLMDSAIRASLDSKATRLKVGAVVTDSKGNFVASGYNGTIRGFHTNDCEKKVYHRSETRSFGTPWVDKTVYPFSVKVQQGDDQYEDHYRLVTDETITIHAEQNVIAHAARRGVSIDGGIAVLTHSPCSKCTSLLIQCGITEAIYKEKHRSFDETNDLYGSYIRLTQYKG